MTFAQFVNGLISIIDVFVVPLIFLLAFVSFIWGIVSHFFLAGDDERKRAEGSQFALWGILGMVVLFSVWGLINISLSTLGIAPSAPSH